MSPDLLMCRHHRDSQESRVQQLRGEMQKSLTMWLFLWVSLLRPAAFGFQLNDTFGQFQSPGFPTAYGDNIYQTWNISVPRGFVIKLYFSHFNLEPSYRCGYDHIKILTGQQLVKLCGETSTDTEEVPGDKQYFSTGNNMTVIFRTDYSNEKNYTGFAAHYAAVDIDECDQAIFEEPFCDHFCHNYLGGYYCSCKLGHFLDSDNRICREGKLGEEKQDGEPSKGPLKAPEATTGVQEEKPLQVIFWL
ncbi:mannan-binding lectin serine protease 1-like isoform X1 [Scyliorhinus canicula]|uniref:mannan-binding lectin serine protease 1-like isoform X1 n=1 Tax=Scyliorhinus canicula TaxID=7830 RepID=UPI0018F69AA3|nr:mannan-binding lectin serine protease 1-like isoform X1 [Scyliorhinus canicula]